MSFRPAGDRGAARAAAALAAVLGLTVVIADAYTVRLGDTLSDIALSHGTSIGAIASLNGIGDVDRIYAGDRLRLPGGAVGSTAAGAGVAGGTHRVAAGQTLSGIAARYGVPVRALAALNDLGDIHRVYAGQRLSLPGSSGGGATGSGRTTHVVEAGETLSGIAARYRVAVNAIVRLNDLESADYVRSGQRLVVPTAPGQPAPRGSVGLPRDEVGRLLTETANRYGWNPAFVKAVAWQESGWNNDVVSSVGAIGVMQVLPSTGDFVSTYLVGRDLDLHDPADNIEAGIAFLDYLHRLTGGDARRILGGYYQGLRSIDDNGVYRSTRRYIANVLALKGRFS